MKQTCLKQSLINTVRSVAALTAAGAAMLVVTAALSPSRVDANPGASVRCALEGTWVGIVDATGNATANPVRLTAIPLDPTNQRVSLQIQNAGEDPNFGGIVEAVFGVPATTRTDFWGEAVRTGPRTFDFTILAHAVNRNVVVGTSFQPVYTELVSGTIRFTDCNTIERTASVAFFGADQNPFVDTPAVCSTFQSSLTRLVQVPRCAP